MGLENEKYVSFTTFKRDGTPVSIPVWLVPLDNGEYGFWTANGSGKTKRLSHTSRVTVQASDGRGKAKPDAPVLEGTARVVIGDELEGIRAKVKAKYGFATKVTKALGTVVWKLQGKDLTYADAGIIISVHDAG